LETRNYRSISILCSISKELERIAADQIKVYLDEYDILDSNQTAYQKDSSTQTAIIGFLNVLAADKQKITLSIFFDFTKAFDFISHYLLIRKLRSIGLFLFRVAVAMCLSLSKEIGGQRSHHSRQVFLRGCNIRCNILQGSVLGPLLFVLYLDFKEVLNFCYYSFYADDLLIYL